MPSYDVAIIGGGAIGLSTAWLLAEEGRQVVLLDREKVGRGASWAAAGMLAPAAEIGFEELDLYDLGRDSLRRWPAFANKVEQASGASLDYDERGALLVADDRDQARVLRRLYDFQREHEVPVEWLSGEEAIERVPLLSPRVPAAVWSPSDHSVDPRRLIRALAVAARKAGVEIREHTKVIGTAEGNQPTLLLEDEKHLEAKAVLVAAGAWTSSLRGMEPDLRIRPVKGQMLLLRMTEGTALGATVRGRDAYLVPRRDGRILVGATSEDVGFDETNRAGGVFRLLEGAVEIVPGVEEWTLEETWVGFRPASRDHRPVLGQLGEGIFVATGHYRHGILLTPVTAQEMSQAILSFLAGSPETPDLLRPFSPSRFCGENGLP